MKAFLMRIAVETYKLIRIVEIIPYRLRDIEAEHAIEIAAALSQLLENVHSRLVHYEILGLQCVDQSLESGLPASVACFLVFYPLAEWLHHSFKSYRSHKSLTTEYLN